MKIKEIINILNAKIVTGEKYLDKEIEYAFASDMMSDVLTVEMRNILFITGLANIQAMRTAEMSDARTVLLVRNKKATKEMKDIAIQNDMVLLE
jgi:hypothetical protein